MKIKRKISSKHAFAIDRPNTKHIVCTHTDTHTNTYYEHMKRNKVLARSYESVKIRLIVDTGRKNTHKAVEE